MSACEHRHLSANPIIKFGEPVHARCEACGAAVPIALTLLLQGQADAAQNGPLEVSEAGEWTRPGDDVGTVVCRGVLDGSGAWHGPSPGGTVRDVVEAWQRMRGVVPFEYALDTGVAPSARYVSDPTRSKWWLGDHPQPCTCLGGTILHPDDILATLLPGGLEICTSETRQALHTLAVVRCCEIEQEMLSARWAMRAEVAATLTASP